MFTMRAISVLLILGVATPAMAIVVTPAQPVFHTGDMIDMCVRQPDGLDFQPSFGRELQKGRPLPAWIDESALAAVATTDDEAVLVEQADGTHPYFQGDLLSIPETASQFMVRPSQLTA